MRKILILLLMIVYSVQSQNFPKSPEKFQSIVLKTIRNIYDDLNRGYMNSKIVKRNNSDLIPIDSDIRLLVKINYNDPNVLNKLLELSCEIVDYTDKECYLWLPFEKIEQVVSINGVLSIWHKGLFESNSVIGEGYSFLHGDKARNLFYADGTGIKVGVISDGMNNWDQSYLNGDLPGSIYSIDNSYTFPGSEGTAMMEIIYDFAPKADFWFGGLNNTSTPLTMVNRISSLSSSGCKVIVDDIGWLTSVPYFQEWEISASINQFVNNGGCYISAAGNYNGKIYSGNSYNISDTKSLLWQGTDSLLDLTLNNCNRILIVFQWANDWMNAADNFDLYLYDPNGNLIDSSVIYIGYGKHPEEIIEYPSNQNQPPLINGNYKVKVVWKNYFFGSAKPEVKLLVKNYDGNCTLEYKSFDRQIFGHQITRNLISVAAASYKNYPNKGVEPFSSRGPAVVYFSIVTETRKHPVITAIDSVQTYVGQ